MSQRNDHQHALDSSSELPEYTTEDLEVLHEIIALALSASGKHSFRTVWRAYDAVLDARQISIAPEKAYFRFISRMQGAPGDDIREKFEYVLGEIGVDAEKSEFREPPEELTAAFHSSRFDELRGAREKARQSQSSASETEYHAEDESRPRHRRRRMEIRSRVSPREEAMKVAGGSTNSGRLRRSRSPLESIRAAGDLGATLRVPDDAADRLYDLRQRTMQRQYFRYWHAAMAYRRSARMQHNENRAELFRRISLMRAVFDGWREKRWFAMIERRAEARYNQILIVNAWSMWVQQTAAIVQRTHEVRQRILARKFFNAWREVVANNEAKVREFQLARRFYKWTDRYNERVELEQAAAEFYEDGLVRRAYWAWFFKLYNALAPRRYDGRLTKAAFDQWLARADKVTQLDDMAKAFSRRRLLGAVFAHWAQLTESNLERQDLAFDYSELKLKQVVFGQWRSTAIVAPRIRAIAEFRERDLARSVFELWYMRSKNEAAAAELYDRTTICRFFRVWRLALRQRVLLEYQVGVVKRSVMTHWIRQDRYRLLKRINDRRLMWNVVHRVARSIQSKSKALIVSRAQAETFRNTSLARSVLLCWVTKSNQLISMSAQAEVHYETLLIKNAFEVWRARRLQYQTLERWANDAVYYFSVKRAMDKLLQAYQRVRKTRLQQAYRTVSRSHKRVFAANILSRWRRKLWQLEEWERQAIELDSYRLQELGQNVFRHWRERSNILRVSWQEAEEYDETGVLRLAFNVWLGRHQGLVGLRQLADGRRVHAELAVLAAFKKRWSNHLWEVEILKDKGQRLRERNDQARRKSILRMWKDRCKRRQQRDVDEDTNQLEGFSMAVLPSASGVHVAAAVTPFMTPNWRTTGRRRALFGAASAGAAVPRTPVGSPGSPLRRFAGFARSTLGRLPEPVDEEEDGTLVGSHPTTEDKW